MTAIPHLTANDVQAELEQAYGHARQHHLFAYFGTGEETTVQVKGAGDVRVVPVRSELELRERMPPLDDTEARVAFLVPWIDDVPIDLAGRFALHGRVRRIGSEARLKQLFGVREVDEDALRSPLVPLLLRSPVRYASSDGRLTADAMWTAWLAREWHVPVEGGLALDALLGWAASDARGPRFVEAMSQENAAGVRDAWLAHLAARLGKAATFVWTAWEQGAGARMLELAVLFEVLADSPVPVARAWLKIRIADFLDIKDDATANEIARVLGREAARALRYVERHSDTRTVRAIVRAADDRVHDEDVRAALRDSTRLPSAWDARLRALGTALAEGAANANSESLDTAVRALRALEGHVFFKDPEQESKLRRAEMATRLLAWLVARPDKRIEPSLTAHGDAEALGRWYAAEGGFVDSARRVARDTPEEESELWPGIRAVLRAADDARTMLDRRFARSLVAWVEAWQPSERVVPLADVTERIVARFLDDDAERKLLVLLLDGMAWAQAIGLLDSLGQHAAPWGPLAWHSTAKGRIGEGPYPVAFAALPTITEVSRSSFFAGKTMKPGARLDSSSDPAHWAANAHVKKYAQGTDVPRLLLRSEAQHKGGGASAEALSLVASERRVVAIVVNAIDDSLKASHATRHAWGVGNIAPLPDLLDKAREHGRSVLLVSDHGHVPAGRLQRVTPPHPGAGASGGGARWRPWPTADAPVADDEVAFAASGVYVPKGAHGIVLLADDASCYAGNTHAGEHGGATLAEVIAPCLLIGCADRDSHDPALAVGAAYVPSWWHFDARPVESSPERDVGSRPPGKAKKVPKDERQLGLEIVETVAAPRQSAFAASKVFAARLPDASKREPIARAVDILLERQGTMSADAFAAAMKMLPFRVGGYVSKLQEVLNLDGYEVIGFDPKSRQVKLDLEKLAQLFEVAL